MAISGISGLSAMYDISSVYGNPVSTSPISAIDEDTSSNPALVIAEEKPAEEVQLPDREPASSVATGDFAQILQIQEEITSQAEGGALPPQIATIEQQPQTNYNDIMNQMMSQSSFNIGNIAMA
ncbi:MAG: hypothetical protein K6G40_01540 [Eubacterium sp.]|nr:hypothetical protein [Eubacterium sp.]